MTTDTRVTATAPHDIAAVESSYRTDEVNQYLECGWVITAIGRNQSGPDDVSIVYHLGWSRHLGVPQLPEAIQANRDRWEGIQKRSSVAGHIDSDGGVPF